MLALDSAANGYERSEPSFLGGQVAPYAAADLGDRASVFCRDDSRDAGIQCHWNVLAGQSWVSFFFQNVPRSEVENGVPVKDSGMSTIVRTALEALEESPRRTITRPESSLVPCDETLSPESLGRIFDADPSSLTIISGRPVEDSLGRSTPAFGQVMWAYSYERLGYSECAFGGPNVQGSVMIAPGAAWILTEPDAKHGELVEVAGFGPGVDECRTEGTFTLCTVAVAIGDDLALAQVVPIDPGAGSAQARALITSLLPND
jgi:hypothetical protein